MGTHIHVHMYISSMYFDVYIPSYIIFFCYIYRVPIPVQLFYKASLIIRINLLALILLIPISIKSTKFTLIKSSFV